MASAELKPEGSRNFLTDLAPWADTLSKGVAAIAIAVYVCGFLVISLHHSKYGFIGTNPFRPRILAAGAWFLFFSAVPISAALRFRQHSWQKLAQETYFVWMLCLGLSYPFVYLLFDMEYAPVAHPRTNWWVLGPMLLGGVIAVVALNSKKLPPWLTTALSLLVVGFLVQANLRDMLVSHNFQLPSITLWFFGVFLVTLLEVKLRSVRSFTDEGEWAKPLGTIFALFVFAQYYYPHLKASWGGGKPVSVTVYFTKESAIDANKAVSAQLIEESDEGFYIVGPKETRAIFVPRSSVALIYFSDKVAESPLLREGK